MGNFKDLVFGGVEAIFDTNFKIINFQVAQNYFLHA